VSVCMYVCVCVSCVCVYVCVVSESVCITVAQFNVNFSFFFNKQIYLFIYFM
jgi:hypothetical protein